MAMVDMDVFIEKDEGVVNRHAKDVDRDSIVSRAGISRPETGFLPPSSHRRDSQATRDHDPVGERDAVLVREKEGTYMNKFLRKLLLLFSGQFGTILVSLLTLSLTFLLFGDRAGWVFQALVAIILIRTGYFLTRGPRPVLEKIVVRKYTWRLAVDEGKICTAFLAASFIMGWPLTKASAAVFVLSNFVGQMTLMWFSRLALGILTRFARNGGAASLEKRVLIVGTGPNARKVADMIQESPQFDARLDGFLDFHRTGLWSYHDVPLIGHPKSLEDIIASGQVDALFVAVESSDLSDTSSLFDTAEKMGVAVLLMPDVYHPKVARVRPSYIGGLPALVYRAVPENQVNLLLKGLVDRVGALIGLAVATPVMLVTAALIKLESNGPVFFRQVRSGINGKTFELFKFRTMCCDAENKKSNLLRQNEMSGPVFKMKNDPRITRIGHYLRKYSIDELPQFFNVLKGDMSLVGPRPPLPKEVVGFEPWQRRKLSMKPGVTCIWQVNGRNAIDFEEWMKLDLEYIDNWSLWLDAKILARTLPTVMKGTGT